MAHRDGTKSGGRTAGTPNKATRELKGFLGKVFTRAFTETATIREEVPGDEPGSTKFVETKVSLEDALVRSIVLLTIDPSLLKTLLAYYAGQPAKSIDHNHKGKVTLEQIVAGTAADAGGADVDDEDL